MTIHPTALIHPGAEIGEGVEVGPYCVIGKNVRIGKGTRIGAHVVIDGWSEIGPECEFFPFSSIGAVPQDLKFQGEESRVVIGQKNIFREFVTVHRGTRFGDRQTVIGDENFFMAYSHIAHDCHIGSHVIMANAASLGGHITIGDYAVIGGLVGIHQYVRIGAYALVGGCSGLNQDVPPYVLVSGVPAKLYGLNIIGLKRHGFSEERIEALKRAYKILFRSRLTVKEAIKQVRADLPRSPDVEEFVRFIETSERGVCR